MKRPNWNKRNKRRAGKIQQWRHEMNRVGPSRADRLALLQKWANVQVRRPKGETTSERRAAYNRRWDRFVVQGTCWVCSRFRDLITHHVIQIQHGGYSWHLNLIKICETCHAEIHPWLAPGKDLDVAPDQDARLMAMVGD